MPLTIESLEAEHYFLCDDVHFTAVGANFSRSITPSSQNSGKLNVAKLPQSCSLRPLLSPHGGGGGDGGTCYGAQADQRLRLQLPPFHN
jgi:hypothetical protein